MISVCKHIIILHALFAMFFFMSSCDTDKLTKERAENVLNKTYMEDLADICTLDKSLPEQAELADIKDEQFCEAGYIVTEIFFISHNAVNVGYRIVITPRPDATKRWLNALEKLEERIKNSPEWEKFRGLKQKVNDLLENKELEVEKGKTNFTHYDFGWSVVGGSR